MRKRKKVISFLLTLALVFGLMPVSFGEPAEVLATETPTEPIPISGGTCGENLTWELTVDTEADWDLTQGNPYKLTIKGSGAMTNFSHNKIAPWYYFCSTITSISLPEGITTIGSLAFFNCTSLKSVTIPDSVITIEDEAFSNCYLLETIRLGQDLKTIGEKAFIHCKQLKSITIPDKVTSIGKCAFYSTLLTTIQLNEGLLTIGEGAFQSSNLKTISLPSTINTIGKEAFDTFDGLKSIQVAQENPNFFVSNNILYERKEDATPYRVVAYAVASSLDAVTIEEGVELIDSKAFNGAKNLTSIVLPDTLKKIEEGAFNACKNLEKLNLPNKVEWIGAHAFSFCNFTEFQIPDSVKTIKEWAFGYNNSLKKVWIGKGLEEISGSSFSDCSLLSNIVISEENPYLEAIDNVVYDKGHTILYFYPITKPDIEYSLPDTVETISEHAIYKVSSLEELYMPATLTEIGNCGIYINKKLKSIYFKGNAPTLKQDTYSICSNADNLILYHVPFSKGWNATEWSKYTFAEWQPEDLTQQEGEIDGISWKYEGNKGRILFTGSGNLRDFSEEEPAPWSSYVDSIQTIEAAGINGIGANAFHNAGKLIRLETDESLKTVGDYAFADCGKLQFLEIATLEKIGMGAFQGCSKITEVTLGSHLKSLESEVFADCPALVNFIVPESVTSIKNGAFRGCSSLRTINIPANVTTIEAQAFAGNTALEKVYFYGKVPENWAKDTFSDCSDKLTLCYRKVQTDWKQLGDTWNGFSLLGLERFYTEKQDHYSFTNTASSFGYPSNYKFSRQRYVDVLDSIISGTYYYAIDNGWRGSCYGMASTTLEFYENPEAFPLSNYNTSAKNLYEISAPRNKDAALTKLIEAYQISQYKPEISGWNGNLRNSMKSYRKLVQKVEEFERSGGLRVDAQSDPIVIIFYSDFSGHAVIPVSVEQEENGDFLLKVYDPNTPSALQNLTVKKDFSGISYKSYDNAYASYVPYSAITAAMSGIELHSDVPDTSVYISIDKEQGTVVNAEGKTIDEIEGAYEQKPLNGEDVFSGIRSFVLPEGNYQVMPKPAEKTEDTENTKDTQKDTGNKITDDNTKGTEDTEKTEENSVTFYLASADNFAEITSSDKDAVLDVQKTDNENGEITMELQSESTEEETSSFTVMNQQGMERTVEVTGGNATVSIAEDNGITVKVPADVEETISVSIDGKEVEITDGQSVSSFEAAPEENPLKISEFETNISCDEETNLNGTVDAIVISNTADTKNVTITADYFDKNNKKVASYSKETQLQVGMNLISFAFEGLPTEWEQTKGEASLSCTLTVLDESNHSVVDVVKGIVVSLGDPSTPTDPTKPENPTDPTKPTNPTDPTKPTNPTKPTVIAVKSVKAKPTALTLGLGESAQLSASVSPQNATDKSLYFTASNDKISVTKTGKITAKKTGASQVIIKSSNGKQAIVKITVKKAPKKITLNAQKKTLTIGKQFQIKVKLPKGTASNKITYSSSKKSVAEVSPSGRVKAKKKGKATITVKTFQGVAAHLQVTVKKPIAVKKVTVSKQKVTLGVGESFVLQTSVSPKNATEKKLTFHASNKKVMVTSKGKITAKSTGKTRITVKASNGKKAIVTVNVKKAPKKVTLNEKKKSLHIGQKFQIKVKLPKGTASNKITYSSNRNSVAKVSSSGKVTAKKKGTAIITVKTFNKKTARLKITVKK